MKKNLVPFCLRSLGTEDVGSSGDSGHIEAGHGLVLVDGLGRVDDVAGLVVVVLAVLRVADQLDVVGLAAVVVQGHLVVVDCWDLDGNVHDGNLGHGRGDQSDEEESDGDESGHFRSENEKMLEIVRKS